MGADTLFNWDHFYPLYGDPDGKHFECWTLLGAMAEVTERVEFGALVTCNSYRNPNLLADMARTVDHISGGRLILGIGSGWFQRDYDEYGYDFKTAPDRLRDLDASMPVIEDRLGKLNPPPTRRIPILIGGGGREGYAAHRRPARAHLERLRRPRAGGPQERHPRRVVREGRARPGRDRALRPDRRPDQIENADRYVEKGITHLMLGFGGPDYDLAPLRELIAWRDEYRERNPEVLAG